MSSSSPSFSTAKNSMELLAPVYCQADVLIAIAPTMINHEASIVASVTASATEMAAEIAAEMARNTSAKQKAPTRLSPRLPSPDSQSIEVLRLINTHDVKVLPGEGIAKSAGGIAQITAAIHPAEHPRTAVLNALHLVLPSSPGVLQFPGGDFSAKTLGLYADVLQTWFTAERASAQPLYEPQLFIYSNDFNLGHEGQSLIDHLYFLTGAEVVVVPLPVS
ncbi:MAG: DUF4347 domain-containing protein [Cyanobacteria bacterium P01_F01_bin.53]